MIDRGVGRRDQHRLRMGECVETVFPVVVAHSGRSRRPLFQRSERRGPQQSVSRVVRSERAELSSPELHQVHAAQRISDGDQRGSLDAAGGCARAVRGRIQRGNVGTARGRAPVRAPAVRGIASPASRCQDILRIIRRNVAQVESRHFLGLTHAVNRAIQRSNHRWMRAFRVVTFEHIMYHRSVPSERIGR